MTLREEDRMAMCKVGRMKESLATGSKGASLLRGAL